MAPREQIIREHGPAVFTTAWHLLGDATEAEAVVQDVFLQAPACAEADRREPCLRGLAVCCALDRLRHRQLDCGAELSPADRLRAALARLPALEAAAFALYYFEDLSYAQIADALRFRRPAAAAAALRRGQARLETLLTQTTACPSA